jgi:hypothetical protein
MSKQKALTVYPIHEFLAERWSPYALKDHPVSEADLCSLFEAGGRHRPTMSNLGATSSRPRGILSFFDNSYRALSR